MDERRARGFFVTGTDTGVGKTLVSCALLHACAARGLRAVGMKPVASGARRVDRELANEDVEQLRASSNVSVPRVDANPYCFEPPIAPHIAAQLAGVTIELARIERAYRRLASAADAVVVEGVGGFRVPLDERADTADLAARLALPLVLVVGVRLGCLNHALLTMEAIRTRGLTLAAWVANQLVPEMAHAAENIQSLAQHLGAPCIGSIPYQRAPRPQHIAPLLAVDRLPDMASHASAMKRT